MFTAESIAKRLGALNLPVPKEVETVIEVRRAINSAATADPSGVLAADLLEGKVTAKQAAARVREAARALTEREKARRVAADLDNVLERLARRAARAEGERILKSLRPGFDEAVAAVALAAETFGPNPDENHVLTMGPTAIASWQLRKQAVAVLGEVRRLLDTLADAGYGTRCSALTFLAEAPDLAFLDQAHAVYRNGAGEGLIRLASHGLALRLNLPDEANQIAAAARLATEEADALAREEAEGTVKARQAKEWGLLKEEIAKSHERNTALEHLGRQLLDAGHPGLKK